MTDKELLEMDKPILFSTEMVKAILDGRKTQTRRVMRPQPWGYSPSLNADGVWEFCDDVDTSPLHFHKSPYGNTGDRLWIRETWQAPFHFDMKPSEMPNHAKIVYRADGAEWSSWKPSIFMPRWASRITLNVLDVRVERVQDISYSDVKDEGVDVPIALVNDPKVLIERIGEMTANKFAELWDTLNAKRGYSWNENPWVWVVEFEVSDG